MKKITLKLSTFEVQGLDRFFDDFLNVDDDLSSLEKCAYAVLVKWRFAKLKPKTYFNSNVKHRFKLEPDVAFALLSFIEQFPINPADQFGEKLLEISSSIHQKFA